MSEAPDFVHLRTRTHYSLLTATADVGDMVAAAAADGQKALALTDNGNLFGAVEFYKACKEKGLRSVLGLTAYVAGKSMREPTSAENPSHDLTLLAATQEGWDNLRLLSSRSWLEGFSYRPRIDLDLLAKHGKGLIVLSGSTAGEDSAAGAGSSRQTGAGTGAGAAGAGSGAGAATFTGTDWVDSTASAALVTFLPRDLAGFSAFSGLSAFVGRDRVRMRRDFFFASSGAWDGLESSAEGGSMSK